MKTNDKNEDLFVLRNVFLKYISCNLPQNYCKLQ